MSEQRQIMKNSQIMMAVTSVSRVFGLVRDQVIAFLLGTSIWADVWTISSLLPNMFRRLIAEGAMSSAFVPIFSELTEKGREEESRHFIRAVFSLIFLAVTVLVSVIVLLLPVALPALLSVTNIGTSSGASEVQELAILPTRLMFPYLIFISLASICQGVLNVNNRFALSAATPIMLNISLIGCGWFMRDSFGSPIWGLCVGFLLGGFLQFFMQWLHLQRLGFRVWPTLHMWTAQTAEAVRLWVPSVFSAGVVQINALVSTLVATNILVGAATAVSYSSRLMELVLGVFAVAVSTSLLPVLARQRSRGDLKSMNESLFGAIEVMSFIAIPAAMGLILCGPTLIGVLFERGAFDSNSTQLTYLALLFHAMAIVPICWYRISIQAFYAFKQVKATVYIAVVGVVVNITCCFLLPGYLYFPHAGVAAATCVSSWVLYLLARWQAGRRNGLHWPNRLNGEIFKILVATCAFVPLWLPLSPRTLSLTELALKMLLSAVIYAGVARLLRVAGLFRLMHKK